MNIFNKQVASYTSIILIFCGVLVSCATKTTSENTLPDTTTTITTVATLQIDSIIPIEQPKSVLVITDSVAKALSEIVDAKFDSLYSSISDTSLYYQVDLEDYYDEYEGQDQKKTIEWYFSKELAVVYAKYTFESGSLDQPEVTEYILRDNQILYLKKESELYGPDNGRAYRKWSSQLGGVKLNWSEYWKEIKSVDPLPDDYLKTIQEEWDANLSLLISTISKEEQTGDEAIYYIDIRVPKHAELVDYTSVTIPKQVYKKLRK
jgi:hypothetical protein